MFAAILQMDADMVTCLPRLWLSLCVYPARVGQVDKMKTVFCRMLYAVCCINHCNQHAILAWVVCFS